MANISEKNEWQAIPQIEDGEVFDGGIDGSANKQAKVLANRTAYLKETIQTHTHTPADIGAAPAGYGLGTVAQAATGDWNNYTTTGFYMGSNLTNAPTINSNHWYFVSTIKHNSLWVYQQAHGFGIAVPKTYERWLINGTWKPWKEIVTTDGSITGNAATATKIKSALGTKPATDAPSTWENGMYFTRVYANGYPTAYGELLTMKHGGEATQLLLGWSGTDKTPAPLYVRNKRDVGVDTFSDWSQIYTSHTANPVFSGNIGIDTTSPTIASGYGGISINGTKGGVVNFQTGGILTGNISGDNTGIYLTSKSTAPVFLAVSNATKFAVNNSAFYPTTDNAYTIGTSVLRPSQIYAATATINTSDRNAKTDILDTTLGLDFINALRPVEFKYKVRENKVTSEQDGTETVEIEPATYDDEGNVATVAVTKERPIYKEVVTPLPGIRTHVGY